MVARSGLRKVIVVAALLLALAAVSLRLGRVLTQRYPVIAVLAAIWRAPSR